MAATDVETLLGMRTIVRAATGESTTGEVSDAALTAEINAEYRGPFVKKALAENFKTDLTQDMTATDSGEYTLSASEIKLEDPVTVNGSRITLYLDKNKFWDVYPDEETYVTPPTLAIGTSSTASVANAAFSYEIAGWTYQKIAAETVLSGDTVQQNKYGAWKLSIDANGTITVTEAGDNATGYTTAALAVYALENTDADESCMGYVTAINTAGTFIPGTTALDDAGVTDTYTDGDPALRSNPEAVLIDGRTMFVRPKSDDIARLRCPMVLQRPSELSVDADSVFSEEWGYAIAYAVAAQRLMRQHDTEGSMEAQALSLGYIKSIRRDKLLQLMEKPIEMGY